MHKPIFKDKKAGSYTIELSLLTPLIIALFLFIFFMSYFAHDRIIIEKAAYIASLRAALCVDANIREQIAAESFDKETEGRLLGIWNGKIEYENADNFFSVYVEYKMNMEEGLLKKILPEKVFSYSTECRSYCANETECLRRSKKGR